MSEMVLIRPMGEREDRLERVMREAGAGDGCFDRVIRRTEELAPLCGAKILFAVALDETGMNLEWLRMMQEIRRDPLFFSGCIGAVVTDGDSERFTKSVGRELVQSANRSGCLFPGRPLVEGTGSLQNFRVTAYNLRTAASDPDPEESADMAEKRIAVKPMTAAFPSLQSFSEEELWRAYVWSIADLIARLRAYTAPVSGTPKVLALHASVRDTSNTLTLWNIVKESLDPQIQVKEISLQNGAINDCIGCPYTMCMHFSSRGRCYYGGVIVEQVLPALEEADALVMLCPNYNDALSANLAASVNRLTSLYRRRPLYDKYLYGVVVSGYSGGDILELQLISGLNMNKAMSLPPYFSMAETANDPGSILKAEGIRERAQQFAERISNQLLPSRCH